MPAYAYKVKNREGKILQGKLEASDEKVLRKKLDEMHVFLIDYSEEKASHGQRQGSLLDQFQRPSLKELSIFSWQLFTMLNAGLPLLASLGVVIKQAKKKNFRQGIHGLYLSVEQGESFANSLRKFPADFSRLYVEMVNTGEVGGILDEVLKKLAQYYQRQAEITSRLKSAMAYPLLLVAACIGVATFLITFVLPRFVSVFQGIGSDVPMITLFMLGVGTFVRNYYLLILIGIAVFVVFVMWFYRLPQGRALIDRIKLHLPLFGTIHRKTVIARVAETLSALVSGGIPILTCLDVVKEVAGNHVVEEALKGVLVKVRGGSALAESLAEARLFPDMVVNMVKAGEETGALDKMLIKVAEFYQWEVNDAVEAFTKLVEPALMIVMAGVVGFIALSIFLPMTDVIQGITGR